MIYFLIGSYLLGSISSAIIICKMCNLPDPRTKGSKNPGATNVLRIGGKLVAAFVLIFDGLKGALPVILANYFGYNLFDLTIILLCAFLGHVFPIYYGFKGGKGVATALGVLLAIDSNIAILVLLIWLIVFLVSRISSLSAITAALCLPIIAFFMHIDQNFLWLSLFLSMFLIYRHKENIKNLLEKKESNFK